VLEAKHFCRELVERRGKLCRLVYYGGLRIISDPIELRPLLFLRSICVHGLHKF
jgi:hypothetical protein